MATDDSLVLQGLEILVARPTDAAVGTCDQLEALGAQCYRVPAMALVALEEPKLKQRIKSQIMDIDRYQIAIFISQNAVRYGADWIDNYWPQLPVSTRYFAIGSATAAMFNRFFSGELETAAEAMNSEALLALPGLQSIAGERVLIFRGEGGRNTLAQGLLERGAEVDYCELYRRANPEGLSDNLSSSGFGQKKQAKSLICVHSGESLSNLATALNESVLEGWHRTPLLVPGKRVAELANSLGFSSVVVAENASDNSVIDTIQQWYSHQSPQ